jgi:hypothetical protein
MKLVKFIVQGAEFKEHSFDHAEPIVIQVAFDDLKSKFQTFRGKIQAELAADMKEYSASKCQAYAHDAMRATLFNELLQAAQVHNAKEVSSLTYYVNPCEVRATSPVQKGELKLIPDGIEQDRSAWGNIASRGDLRKCGSDT